MNLNLLCKEVQDCALLKHKIQSELYNNDVVEVILHIEQKEEER